ncbi:MAG: ABC transporter permease [Phycisphaerae bacterium]
MRQPKLKLAGKGYIPSALYAVIVIFFTAFFLYPLWLAVREGFMLNGAWSPYWIKTILTDQLLMRKLVNSLNLAFTTTILTLILSLPIAILLTGRKFAGKASVNMLILLPLILPPFVGALSVKRFFAQHGTLNQILINSGLIDFSQAYDWLGTGFIAVMILQVLHLYPIMVLNISSSMANLDPMYYEASRSFGAGKLRTFTRITLPLIRPGIFAGSSIVFIWAFTDIGTPLIFDYNELAAVKIFNELKQSNIDGSAYGFVFIILIITILLYIVGKFVLGKPVAVDSTKAGNSSEEKKYGPLGTGLAWLFIGIVMVMSLLPHIGVILTALSDRWMNTVLPESYTLEHLRDVVMRPQTRNCIINSLKYASVSTTIDLVIGITAAWLIIRKKISGSHLLDGILMLPLAVPGLILAAGFITLTAPGTALAKIGPMYNPFWIIIIAYSVRRVPFVVRGICSGLEQIPETLEHAAQNLGANKFTSFKRITLPLIVSNVIGAGILTFSFAMLEVSDSLVLAQQQQHYPITKQMYAAIDANPDSINIASALGLVGMLLLGGGLFGASLAMGKRLGAIFKV